MAVKEEPKTQWKIFVGGLNLQTTEDSFRKHFSEFGEVVDSVVMVDPHTKKSRGFGFLEFASRAQVDACQAARPHIVDGKKNPMGLFSVMENCWMSLRLKRKGIEKAVVWIGAGREGKN